MKAIAMIPILLLAACATTPTVQTVEIPIAVPLPPAPPITRPALPIADINEHSPPDTVLRAYVATVELLMGYSKSLETLLSGYKEESP